MSALRKVAYLEQLMLSQWLPESLRAPLRLRRLRAIVQFAEENVPLYRETFRKAGVGAKDLRTLGDLARFPLLTREQVVAAYPDGILSRAPRPDDVLFRTSGTSGLFMQIAYDAAANDFLDAIYGRALFSVGYRPWDRIAYFWWDAASKPTRSYERLGLMRKHLLPVDPDPEKQIASIAALDPRVIYHFPSSLILIARELEKRRVDRVRPALVICHGELMTREQRAYIERVFGCPVYDQYGAQEFNRMGWDCRQHDGFHQDDESVHLEFVHDREVVADGEVGEVVVTGLANRLMPLIRYRIGDVGHRVAGRCACGRTLPRFALTEGRLDDVLELPDGARIGPRTLAPRIEQLSGFRQYRVVQTHADRVQVSLVKERDAAADLEAKVHELVARTLGASVSVEVRAVDDIPLSRRGKLRKIIRATGKAV
jgi:phenylacetate-CoA ligase